MYVDFLVKIHLLKVPKEMSGSMTVNKGLGSTDTWSVSKEMWKCSKKRNSVDLIIPGPGDHHHIV